MPNHGLRRYMIAIAIVICDLYFGCAAAEPSTSAKNDLELRLAEISDKYRKNNTCSPLSQNRRRGSRLDQVIVSEHLLKQVSSSVDSFIVLDGFARDTLAYTKLKNEIQTLEREKSDLAAIATISSGSSAGIIQTSIADIDYKLNAYKAVLNPVDLDANLQNHISSVAQLAKHIADKISSLPMSRANFYDLKNFEETTLKYLDDNCDVIHPKFLSDVQWQAELGRAGGIAVSTKGGPYRVVRDALSAKFSEALHPGSEIANGFLNFNTSKDYWQAKNRMSAEMTHAAKKTGLLQKIEERKASIETQERARKERLASQERARKERERAAAQRRQDNARRQYALVSIAGLGGWYHPKNAKDGEYELIHNTLKGKQKVQTKMSCWQLPSATAVFVKATVVNAVNDKDATLYEWNAYGTDVPVRVHFEKDGRVSSASAMGYMQTGENRRYVNTFKVLAVHDDGLMSFDKLANYDAVYLSAQYKVRNQFVQWKSPDLMPNLRLIYDACMVVR